MKKFLRNLLSGYTLVLVILLIEVLAIIFLEFFLDMVVEMIPDPNAKTWVSVGYMLLRFAIFVVALIIFFRIINKEEDPEFKIPWIVVMLLLPLFACIMFLIFGNHGLQKKDQQIINKSREDFGDSYRKLLETNPPEYSLEGAKGITKYLNSVTGLSPHANNRVTYYATGEEFFPEMMKCLREAKEFIFIEFFIITDGKEWSETKSILIEKAKQGVEVRLIYDDLGCGGTISPKTPKELGAYGIKCYKFHPFRPILSGVYNNRDHRKIVVVDHKYGFTGGCNLADEYANEIVRFGYWKDTMVKIEGSAINNLISIFLQNYGLAAKQVLDASKYLDYAYEQFDEEGIVMPFADGPGGIDNALVGEQNYVNLIHYAKEKLYISTPYLIPTYQLTDALRNAALRGVEVNLILPGVPDKKLVYLIAKSNLHYLMEAGVNVYFYKPGFNHMKTAWADGKLAFVGTINFDFRSLVHHFECGTLLYRNPCVKDIEEDFKNMVSVSEKVPKDFTLSFGARLVCALLKIFTPLL